MSETPDEHFSRILLETNKVVLVVALSGIALIALAIAMIPSGVARTAIAASVLASMIGAFVAGNTYRLKDVRTRHGNMLRHNGSSSIPREQLPPRHVIQQRFRASGAGALVGISGMLVTTGITLGLSSDAGAGEWSAVITLIGVVFSALSFVAGTYTRPID